MKQYNSTYDSQKISFFGNPEQRSGTASDRLKDQRLVNCYKETIKNLNGPKKEFLCERPALSYTLSTTAGEGRGIYAFNNGVWSVVGNKLYQDGNLKQTLSTSTGAVGWVEYSGSATYPINLVLFDGISGWVIDLANTVTQITDPDFPSPHQVHGAYMDGYLFLVKQGTADIYNSVLDNPMSWQAGDFITAETIPDPVQALVRQNNYIIAIGTGSIEYFYNAANSPGTPLARNPSAAHTIGSPAPDSVVMAEGQVIFVGFTWAGGRTIILMDGFKPVEIATEQIKMSLDEEGTFISQAKAFYVRRKGHRFYVLNIVNTNRTWVFDFEEREWHEWADYTGANRFPCDWGSTNSPSSTTGSSFAQDRTSGIVFTLSQSTALDASGPSTTHPITMIATSEKYNFGTMDRKFANRFSLVCDALPVDTPITLQWSDDDYKTWSTARDITINDTFSALTQLGSFRRRAFRLTYAQQYPFRMEYAELDFNMGNR